MAFNLKAFESPRVDYPTGPYPLNQAGETTVGNISSGNIDLNAPVIGGYQSQPITAQELRNVGQGVNNIGVNWDNQSSGVDMTAPTLNNQPGFDAPTQPYSLPGDAGGASLPVTASGQEASLSSTDQSFFQTSDASYTGGASIAPGVSSTPADIGSMSPTDGGGQAQDFLGGAYSPSATEGLPGPLQSILGGNQSFNLQSPTSDFSAGTPQAQAKTPASTEGQIAEAKAVEDEAKSIAKAAETAAKATTGLAKQQASTGQQASATAAQDTASSNLTSENIASTTLGTLKDLTQRFFIAFFGLILLAGAVYYFSKSSSPQLRMA
jgi:hypothetical protein